MKRIKILDKYFIPYIKEADILLRIRHIASSIATDYKDKNPLLLSILNGSFMFTSDLMKQIDIPCEVAFVKLASYHGTQSSGTIRTMIGLDMEISNRHVIIIEDIIDTGNTLAAFLPDIQARNAASLKIATLLSKPKALNHDIKIDYCGFEIPNDFIVGYGLDYDGYGRNYRDIYVID